MISVRFSFFKRQGRLGSNPGFLNHRVVTQQWVSAAFEPVISVLNWKLLTNLQIF